MKKKIAMKKPRKQLGIFACPFCRRKPMISLNALNNHITKSHDDKQIKVTLDIQGRAYTRTTHQSKGRISFAVV